MNLGLKKINKKTLFILILVGIILIAVYYFPKSERISYQLDGKTHILRTARAPWEKSRGLSNIREAKKYDGMIFYFDPPEQVTFWNKDTYFDLELIWIKNGQILGRDKLPSITKTGLITKKSPSVVTEVVEMIQ